MLKHLLGCQGNSTNFRSQQRHTGQRLSMILAAHQLKYFLKNFIKFLPMQVARTTRSKQIIFFFCFLANNTFRYLQLFFFLYIIDTIIIIINYTLLSKTFLLLASMLSLCTLTLHFLLFFIQKLSFLIFCFYLILPGPQGAEEVIVELLYYRCHILIVNLPYIFGAYECDQVQKCCLKNRLCTQYFLGIVFPFHYKYFNKLLD